MWAKNAETRYVVSNYRLAYTICTKDTQKDCDLWQYAFTLRSVFYSKIAYFP